MTLGGESSKTKIIWALLALLQAIVTGWVWSIGSKVDKINVIESNYVNLKETVVGIKSDVDQLLKERRR